MRMPRKPPHGYTLIELIVVLFIVGVLVTAGVTLLGDKQGNATRAVMDELEGVLQLAQQNASASGQDVPLLAKGNWLNKSDPIILDGRRASGTFPATADAADTCARQGSTSERFVSQYASNAEHRLACIAIDPGWVTTALAGAPHLKDIPPGNAEPFLSALGSPLFGSDGKPKMVRINGITKRFETGFCIPVVGLSGSNPTIKGAVGLLVVPAGSASVYKFYKPAGSSTWKRI